MWLYPDLTTSLEKDNQEYVKRKNEFAKEYTQAVRDGDEAAKKSASAQKVYFQELDIGFKMSMALILTYDALKDNGGWIALFAWFDQERNALKQKHPDVDDDRELWVHLRKRGQALIGRISPKFGSKNNKRDKRRAFWRSLWRFLVRLEDQGTWEATDIAAVANVATWEDLGWTPGDED